MNTENKPGINQQNYSHQEGQMDNISPQQGAAQRGSTNNSQGLSDMMNESEEQKAGRAHGQKDESSVQQDERQP
jgi:hypothetical protein